MYGDMHIKYLTFLRAQTVLVDGALREGELLIPLPSLEILVLLTFCSPSTGVKSTERVEAVYPLLKDVALSPDMSFCTYKSSSCTFNNILKSRFIKNYNSVKMQTIQMISLNQPYLFLDNRGTKILKLLEPRFIKVYNFSKIQCLLLKLFPLNRHVLNLPSLNFFKQKKIHKVAASNSSGSLDHLNPQYSPAATSVFFDVARTFSKSNCDNVLGT
uniref:Uncharacterized protein n=1 Tax=Brassica campestris TaxID=3711 RepID=A0A3P5ZX85_BRACM|nr:unnamed protein product [Brassica rapa]